MARIEQLLEEWVAKGLLSLEQRNAIAAYEQGKPQRSWALFGVSAIGIVALVTGVISIIAAHWDSISESAQLVGYFCIQSALAIALYRQRQTPGLVREVILILFALFFLAGMGLVGQIYHLESDGRSALHFWLGLTLPVTLFAESRLLPHLWFSAFCTAVGLWIVDAPSDRTLDAGLSQLAVYLRMMWGYTLAFAVTALGLLRQPWMNPVVGGVAACWGLAAIVAVGGSFGGTYASLVLERYQGLPMPIVPWLGALAAVGSVWFGRRPADSKQWRVAMTALLAASAFSITVRPPLEPELTRRLVGLLVFVVVWSAAAVAAASAGRRRLFNFCTFLIAARFVIAYFEVFGSLAATGLGLIFSGVVILGATWLWAKTRGRLLALLGGRG